MSLKSTDGATTLESSPSLEHLQAHLHALIIRLYNHSTKTRGHSLKVINSRFVTDGNQDGKFYSLLTARVKDQKANVTTTFNLTIAVNREDVPWHTMEY